MTDTLNKFNIGNETLQQGIQAQGFRKGAKTVNEAINLAAIFGARGITFGANPAHPDITGNEN